MQSAFFFVARGGTFETRLRQIRSPLFKAFGSRSNELHRRVPRARADTAIYYAIMRRPCPYDRARARHYTTALVIANEPISNAIPQVVGAGEIDQAKTNDRVSAAICQERKWNERN